MEHGAWSMEHGAWSMEHGAWSMEHGAKGRGRIVASLFVLDRFTSVVLMIRDQYRVYVTLMVSR